MISCTERVLRKLFFRQEGAEAEAQVDTARKAMDAAKGNLGSAVHRLNGTTVTLVKERNIMQERLIAAIQELSEERG